MAPPHSGTAFLALAFVLVGCSSTSDPGAASASRPPAGEGRSVVVGTAPPCVPPSPIPFGDVASRLPRGVAFPPGARLLEVSEASGATTVVGETALGITALQDRMRAELTAAGREVFSEDNEGFEAELFFSLPGGGIGVVRATRARCPVGITRISITLS